MNAIKARTDGRTDNAARFQTGRAGGAQSPNGTKAGCPPAAAHRPQNKLASCPVGRWVVPEWFLSCEIGDPMDQHDIWGQLDT